jgi:SAM-dependent methyltransferase
MDSIAVEPQSSPPTASADASDRIELLSEPPRFHMADAWYEYATPDHFWYQWRIDALRRLLEGLDPGQRLLEVGCGNGAARQQLEACYGRPVDGCDLNLYALQRALPGQGRLCLYNVHDRRPEWAGYFDTIFLLDTLEHIETPTGLLESLAWHLKPGGRLVVNVPALSWLYSRYDRLAGHFRRYRKKTLTAELEPAGFRVVRQAYWGLTLLPIAVLRKLVLRFTREDHVITRGFQPPTPLANRLLRTLMYAEQRFVPHPWIGCSLAAVAKYAPEEQNG